MMNDEDEDEIKQNTIISEPRVLKATYTIEQPIKDTESLRKELEDAIDRWTWDTGSDKDAKLIHRLETEIKSNEILDSILKEYADGIAKEIDKHVLDQFLEKYTK